jgi:predicted HTH domain antitoxin
MSLEEKLEKWRRLEEEAREIRRRQADWKFIDSQPPRLRAALKLYIEMGDIRLASKVAGMGVEEFRELLRRARVPVVV